MEEEIKDGIIADLHIHSRFSRATSKQINIENLEKYARIKGLDMLGTGDFQHPEWKKELDVLEERDGILYTKTDFPFIWQTEISLMYTQDDRGRRVHYVILAPGKEIAEVIIKFLSSKGRLDYDGRPIFGFSSVELVEAMQEIDKNIEIIPAHCLPPDQKIFSSNGLISISDIKKGDMVLTHKARFRKVDKTLKRKYNGKLIKVKSSYFGGGLLTTPEHPYYAIKTKKNCSWIKGTCKPTCSQKNCKEKEFLDYKLEWILASDLEKNDVLVYPIIQGEKEHHLNIAEKQESDLWRLIGYYFSEGWSNKRDGIGFCFNIKEKEYIEDLVFLIRKYLDKEVKLRFKGKSVEILVYSKKIMNLFEELFYNSKIKRATTKCLPSWALFLPLEKQKELFVGWWRGDSGVSSSYQLFNQMKSIALRLGIIPNVVFISKEKFNKSEHFINENGKKRKINASTNNYQMSYLTFFEDKFNLLETKEFSKFKRKINRFRGWMDEKYVYLPITNVIEDNYEGYVYNLEVEDDNSYVSEFSIVHNCMTPWFGIFGSKSGFDSLKECFGDKEKEIHAVESGMSADPEMLRKFSWLNDKAIVSFSDLHSFWPWRIGRESTIFSTIKSYKNIIKQIRENSFIATIETEPAYGRYHWDGHRLCKFACSTEKTKELKGICPKCGKPLTIGVENRVNELSNQEPEENKNRKKYYKLLPLHELISLAKASTLSSKKTWQVYNNLIQRFGNEFNVLLNIPESELIRELRDDEKLVELIIDNRQGNIRVQPGFDGQYGIPLLKEKQSKLI